MILMLDNYDSFTYNLVHYLGELGEIVEVYRNDRITIDEIKESDPEILMISPGPCTPKEAGISVELVNSFKGKKPILGVCLGHQSIAQAFGAKIIKAKKLLHGKTSEIYHDKKGIYKGIENPFCVSSIAFMRTLTLLTVSLYSFSGTESATIPAPACR